MDVGSTLFILDPKRVVANRLLSVSASWGVDVGSHALLSFGVNPQNGNQHYPCIAIAYLWGLDSGAAHPSDRLKYAPKNVGDFGTFNKNPPPCFGSFWNNRFFY